MARKKKGWYKSKLKKKGWQGQPARHSLAARGIETKPTKPQPYHKKVGEFQGAPGIISYHQVEDPKTHAKRIEVTTVTGEPLFCELCGTLTKKGKCPICEYEEPRRGTKGRRKLKFKIRLAKDKLRTYRKMEHRAKSRRKWRYWKRKGDRMQNRLNKYKEKYKVKYGTKVK